MNTMPLGQRTVLLATQPISWLASTCSGPQAGPAPCGVEQVALRTPDGVRLDGLLYRAATTRPAALVLARQTPGKGAGSQGDRSGGPA
jgi:hypothetical protein